MTTVSGPPASYTFLFSDIEGSTRLWETEPERMQSALMRHDAVARAAVEGHRGTVVKMTGDGLHAAFDGPLDALLATLDMQRALAAAPADGSLELRVRCGLHSGSDQRRDGDFFGPAVNRAARITRAAHGGQMLVSQRVAEAIGKCLPEGVALRDLGAVRLRDLERPERIFQIVDRHLRSEFPALRSLEATPNNLPQQLDSFIGRERELAQIKPLLRKTRLLTLLGMGGIGKSRLSLQLAAEVLDEYPDGVWLVELAALQDPALVPPQVAAVLGVKEDPGRSILEALLQFVRDRQLLIVLDNCEHLIEACALFAKRLLQSGAQIRILATSRDYLQIAGEFGYHLAPLEAPAAGTTLLPDALADLDSVQLFVNRASAAQPGFELNSANAAAVADICRHLDGIPLALELAAARLRALSVESIAARLDDRFRLLTIGDRTAAPRQRTLRAVIDWGHDLLPDDERTLFRRLAVFSGGWTLEAAEAVTSSDGVTEADVLELLTRLAEKSLVIVELGGARFRFLETIRHYAQEKLAEAGEERRSRARHGAYFVAFAEQARVELGGPQQGAWLARLDRERDNLLGAHEHGDRDESDVALAVRLIYALRPYWINRGLLTLGLRLAEEVLARPGLAPRNLARCQTLFGAGQICCFMGRYADAIGFLGEALAIARELDDRERIGSILQPLGAAYLGAGANAAAGAHLTEALARARDLGDRRQIAAASNALATAHRLQRQLEPAERLYSDVVAIARELGDQESIGIGLLNLAMVAVDRRAFGATRAMLLEILDIARDTGSNPVGQSALEVCAGLASASADATAAARFFGAAEAQSAQTGLCRHPADDAFLAPWIAQARAALGAADFAAAERMGRALGLADALSQVRAWLGRAAPEMRNASGAAGSSAALTA